MIKQIGNNNFPSESEFYPFQKPRETESPLSGSQSPKLTPRGSDFQCDVTEMYTRLFAAQQTTDFISSTEVDALYDANPKIHKTRDAAALRDRKFTAEVIDDDSIPVFDLVSEVVEESKLYVEPLRIIDFKQEFFPSSTCTSFLVQWENLSVRDATWESSHFISGYPKLLQDFLQRRSEQGDSVEFFRAMENVKNLKGFLDDRKQEDVAVETPEDHQRANDPTLPAAEAIQSRIEKDRALIDAFVSNKLIEAYGRCGSAALARQIFDDETWPKDALSWQVMLVAYSRNGHLREAQRVFESMPHRGLNSWTAMLNLYARNGQLERAMDLFARMPTHDVVCWNSVLAAHAANGHIEEAGEIFERAMPRRDTASWNTILAGFGQNDNVEQMEWIFHEMPQWNLVSWNAKLAAYAANGYLEETRWVFDSMPETDLFSWNTLLSAFAQGGSLQRARSIFDTMPERDLVSWTALITEFAKSGHLVQSRALFDEIPERNLVCWNAMISGYCQNGSLSQAQALFDEMPQRDLVSWTAMIAAYGENGHLSKAKEMFDRMPHKGLVPWITMLSSHAHSGDLSTARVMFESMPHHNLVAWNVIISAHAQAGHLQQTRKLFAAMPQRNLVSWNAMLLACSQHADSPRESRAVFDGMPQHDLVSWNAMLGAYSRLGHVEDARCLFDSMRRRERLDLVSLNVMLAAYTQRGHISEALLLFNGMAQQDIHSWTNILAVYAQAGHLELVLAFFQRMPEHDTVSWNVLLASHCYTTGRFKSSTVLDKTLETSSTMRLTQVPDGACFVSLLSAYSSQGKVFDAMRVFRSMVVDFELQPCKQHYSCMVDVLSRAGRLDDVQDLVDSIPFVPDASDSRCLLANCRNQSANLGYLKPPSEFEEGASFVLLANAYKSV
ncbi:pentatricopeptide repeat-containing protein At4g02750 [Selaginella moellendorffii]|nr:pentatricopeptide repeat-containing protein At4g02750 [Selaginella moellendorffii]|eukprot:XP_024544267.1 pentatricopeptide repeat-containing protein At4g02750 [Selaginella moellendorffii]